MAFLLVQQRRMLVVSTTTTIRALREESVPAPSVCYSKLSWDRSSAPGSCVMNCGGLSPFRQPCRRFRDVSAAAQRQRKKERLITSNNEQPALGLKSPPVALQVSFRTAPADRTFVPRQGSKYGSVIQHPAVQLLPLPSGEI
jgi:hypothetical protein